MHKGAHSKETTLAHAGRQGKSVYGTVNSPVVRGSTMLFPTTAALHAAEGTRSTYGRHGTETSLALEQALCELEGAAGCLLTTCGVSAITLTLLALLKPGDHLLVTDSAYDYTKGFCKGVLKDFGIETTYYDPLAGADIAAWMQPNTRVVFVESPGSNTFEVQDIPAIAQVAHRQGAHVVADSTWATPLGWSPFALGIDVSIHAATKCIVGHSDVLMGAALCTEELHPVLRRMYRALGHAVSPDDAYLALRGLRSMGARLKQHAQSALAVAQWLRGRPEVAQVLYPPLADAPGHALWQQQFNADYASGLMSVVFAPDVSVQAMERLVDATRLFGIGFSWGGYESLIVPTHPAQSRDVTASRWAGLVMARLHIGLEAPADLIADLQQGFAAMRA